MRKIPRRLGIMDVSNHNTDRDRAVIISQISLNLLIACNQFTFVRWALFLTKFGFQNIYSWRRFMTACMEVYGEFLSKTRMSLWKRRQARFAATQHQSHDICIGFCSTFPIHGAFVESKLLEASMETEMHLWKNDVKTLIFLQSNTSPDVLIYRFLLLIFSFLMNICLWSEGWELWFFLLST